MKTIIREALKQVIDPELFVNVIDLGLIYAVETTEKRRQDRRRHRDDAHQPRLPRRAAVDSAIQVGAAAGSKASAM